MWWCDKLIRFWFKAKSLADTDGNISGRNRAFNQEKFAVESRKVRKRMMCKLLNSFFSLKKKQTTSDCMHGICIHERRFAGAEDARERRRRIYRFRKNSPAERWGKGKTISRWEFGERTYLVLWTKHLQSSRYQSDFFFFSIYPSKTK